MTGTCHLRGSRRFCESAARRALSLRHGSGKSVLSTPHAEDAGEPLVGHMRTAEIRQDRLLVCSGSGNVHAATQEVGSVYHTLAIFARVCV